MRRAHTDPLANSCLIRCPIVLAACCLMCFFQAHCGLDLQAALQREGVPLPVIFLTGHPNVASCVQTMNAGAIDFLVKPIEPKALLAARVSALASENSIRTARNEERSSRERLNSLSPRERQILDRVVAGKLNKEIAYELGISERTVKGDRSDIMAKLGAVSIASPGTPSNFATR